MPDRLMVELRGDGRASVLACPEGELPEMVSRNAFVWPLDSEELEDLRWYLEDYLLAPFGVWEDRGPTIRDKVAGWGDAVFASVFGTGAARDAYQRARDRGLEVVVRSDVPDLLALPWELMRDTAGPVALGAGGISRSMPVVGAAKTLDVPGGKLRVLMVISRPAGAVDVGYQMVARPLLERLRAVRGEVQLTVLRPPTFDALRQTLAGAVKAGEPFHVVHFDGHGGMPGRSGGSGTGTGQRPGIAAESSDGVLAFEKPGGGRDLVGAPKVAAALADGQVPVAILNACQSGAVSKELEASVATALLKAGCAAVVAMAYSVYTVAAAEFIAALYESLFAGASVGEAVTAGRKRLFAQDGRPSPRGSMPLADWLVPVHYMRREVRFPQAHVMRPATALSLDESLDRIRAAESEPATARDPLTAVDHIFVGRDDLLYQLDTAARLQRVVVVAGPGGIGKTELAKGFARWWRDTGGVDDPRLVLWHLFEPGVASFGLDGLITATGLELFGPDLVRLDPAERLNAVKQVLAQHRALLIWDNFEAVREMPDPGSATPPLDEAGSAELRNFLEWVRDQSNSAVIITSRTQESWLGRVHRIDVGGLNRAEAAQYAEHLLAASPAAQQKRASRSFGELLKWLNGHPLAMRLTLPRLQTMSPDELLANLHGTIPLALDAESDRLSSLGACITYSVAHLSEETKRLLPAVGLMHGIAEENLLMAFSAQDMGARFAGASRQEWAAALADASRVGLLTRLGPGIYGIHPALPGYLAAEWQAENPASYGLEWEACERAMCSACEEFGSWLSGQIESGDAAVAFTIIDLLRHTFGAMLDKALNFHMWQAATNIVRTLGAYWESRGLDQEASAWTDRIFNALEDLGQPLSESAGALWLITKIQQAAQQKNAGRADEAERTYRQALAYIESQSETEWGSAATAFIYHQIGMTAEARSLDEAENWYKRSLTIREELGDHAGMASSYHQLGTTAYLRRHLDEAEDWYRKALAIDEELGDRPHAAGAYNQLGLIAQDRGQLDEADDWYRKSLSVKETLGNQLAIANTQHQLGTTAYLRRRLDEAEEWYRQSLTIREELGNLPGMTGSYHHLGMLAQDRGRLDEAEDWYRRSLDISEGLGNRFAMASTSHQLGTLAEDRGRLEEARSWYRKALSISEELGNQDYMAATVRNLNRLAETQHQSSSPPGSS